MNATIFAAIFLNLIGKLKKYKAMLFFYQMKNEATKSKNDLVPNS